MLGQVVMSMSQRFQFAPCLTGPALRPTPIGWVKAGKVALRSLPLLISLLVCAASMVLLQAQTSAPSANPGATAPAAPSSASPAPTVPTAAGSSASPAFPISGFGAAPAAFGQETV